MITFQFVAFDDLGSKAIRIFERGWPSHVDAVLPDGSLLGARSDAVGGKPPGVQIRPPNYERWSRVERVALVATPEQEAAWLAFLLGEIGKPYDPLAIFAFPIGTGWHKPGHWICSGLGAAALTVPKPSWLPKPMTHPPEEVTPFELLLVVSPWAV